MGTKKKRRMRGGDPITTKKTGSFGFGKTELTVKPEDFATTIASQSDADIVTSITNLITYWKSTNDQTKKNERYDFLKKYITDLTTIKKSSTNLKRKLTEIDKLLAATTLKDSQLSKDFKEFINITSFTTANPMSNINQGDKKKAAADAADAAAADAAAAEKAAAEKAAAANKNFGFTFSKGTAVSHDSITIDNATDQLYTYLDKFISTSKVNFKDNWQDYRLKLQCVLFSIIADNNLKQKVTESLSELESNSGKEFFFEYLNRLLDENGDHYIFTKGTNLNVKSDNICNSARPTLNKQEVIDFLKELKELNLVGIESIKVKDNPSTTQAPLKNQETETETETKPKNPPQATTIKENSNNNNNNNNANKTETETKPKNPPQATTIKENSNNNNNNNNANKTKTFSTTDIENLHAVIDELFNSTVSDLKNQRANVQCFVTQMLIDIAEDPYSFASLAISLAIYNDFDRLEKKLQDLHENSGKSIDIDKSLFKNTFTSTELVDNDRSSCFKGTEIIKQKKQDVIYFLKNLLESSRIIKKYLLDDNLKNIDGYLFDNKGMLDIKTVQTIKKIKQHIGPFKNASNIAVTNISKIKENNDHIVTNFIVTDFIEETQSIKPKQIFATTTNIKEGSVSSDKTIGDKFLLWDGYLEMAKRAYTLAKLLALSTDKKYHFIDPSKFILTTSTIATMVELYKEPPSDIIKVEERFVERLILKFCKYPPDNYSEENFKSELFESHLLIDTKVDRKIGRDSQKGLDKLAYADFKEITGYSIDDFSQDDYDDNNKKKQSKDLKKSVEEIRDKKNNELTNEHKDLLNSIKLDDLDENGLRNFKNFLETIIIKSGYIINPSNSRSRIDYTKEKILNTKWQPKTTVSSYFSLSFKGGSRKKNNVKKNLKLNKTHKKQ